MTIKLYRSLLKKIVQDWRWINNAVVNEIETHKWKWIGNKINKNKQIDELTYNNIVNKK
jgi:hypothetical protein